MSTKSAKLDSGSVSFRSPIAAIILVLVLLVASQSYVGYTFQERGFDLPFQTKFALGTVPPLLLAALLMVSAAVNHSNNTRVRNVWKAQ